MIDEHLPSDLVRALPASLSARDVIGWVALSRGLSAAYGEAYLVLARGGARPLFAVERTSVTEGFRLVALDEGFVPRLEASSWEERLLLRTAEREQLAVPVGLADREQVVGQLRALRRAMGAEEDPKLGAAGEREGLAVDAWGAVADGRDAAADGRGAALGLGPGGEPGAGVELAPEERLAAFEAALARGPEASRALVLQRSVAELRRQAGDVTGASAAYSAMLAIDPSDREAVGALVLLLSEVGDWVRLVDVLERAAAQQTDPGTRAPLLKSIARTFEDGLGDLEAAVGAWRRACEEAPRDEEALAGLERCLEREERWAELAEVLQVRLSLAARAKEASSLHRRLAKLHEDRLGNPKAATAHWEALLVLAPRDAEALDAFARTAGEPGHAPLVEAHARPGLERTAKVVRQRPASAVARRAEQERASRAPQPPPPSAGPSPAGRAVTLVLAVALAVLGMLFFLFLRPGR
jgi:tetratricopeptide (TPR) repeat protein